MLSDVYMFSGEHDVTPENVKEVSRAIKDVTDFKGVLYISAPACSHVILTTSRFIAFPKSPSVSPK